MDVVIVGAGWLGGVHADAALHQGDRVVAVIDTDERRRETFAERYVAAGYASVADALDHPFDAAIIATPNTAHLAPAAQLVAAGKHVLIEKPHRTPGQDPTPLVAAVQSNPQVVCQIGMSLRFVAGAREVRDAVVAGELGEILTYQDRTMYQLTPEGLSPWYFDHAFSGGGVSVTNGVHAVDRACWILGDLDDWSMRSARVFADHDDEDLAVITARRPSDAAQVTLLLAWADWPVSPSELLIVGTRGQARIHEHDGWSVDSPSGSRSGPNDPLAGRFDHQWAWFRQAVQGGQGGPQLGELEPVLDVLRRITPAQPTLLPT